MVEENGEQAAGEQEDRKPWTQREFGRKTIWEWMQLLIIPLVLALFGFAFTWTQDRRAQAIEDQRTQDGAVQAYLDKMSDLMLQRDLRAEEEGTARTLARARTLTVLEDLDADHKRSVMRFLWESALVQAVKGRKPDQPVVELPVIDLKGVDLSDTNLRAADLYGADLGEGIERGTGGQRTYKLILTLYPPRTLALDVPQVTPALRTNLSGADLSDADLSYADLVLVDLHDANLGSAILSGAVLYEADLSGANLSSSAGGFGTADLTGAILYKADLSFANLQGTNLQYADLSQTNLTFANLKDADLKGADLREAYEYNEVGTKQRITNEELEQQAASLEGATMPNGQKYEDWPGSRARVARRMGSGPGRTPSSGAVPWRPSGRPDQPSMIQQEARCGEGEQRRRVVHSPGPVPLGPRLCYRRLRAHNTEQTIVPSGGDPPLRAGAQRGNSGGIRADTASSSAAPAAYTRPFQI